MDRFLLLVVAAALGVIGSDAREVCYTGLGCFTNEDVYSHFIHVPESPEKIGFRGLLFTKRNIDLAAADVLTYYNKTALLQSHFDSKLPVKIIIHGYKSQPHSQKLLDLKNALLKKGDFNVVIVDWQKGSKRYPFEYPQAGANIRVVAAATKKLLDMMVKEGSKWEDVHIIGHSLGAHISGMIGALSGSKVGRITGLDPAGPFFEGRSLKLRLDKGDAKFVDAMHTNAKPFTLFSGFGTADSSGHVDFYPNGGDMQKGCSNRKRRSCSHNRVVYLFTESLVSTTCKFRSYPCTNYEDFQKGKCMSCGSGGCGDMGYYADKAKGRGALYLETMSEKTFCGDSYVVEISTSSKVGTKGKFYIKAKGPGYETTAVPVTSSDVEVKDPMTIQRLIVFRRNVDDATKLIVQFSTSDPLTIDGLKMTSYPSKKVILTCPGTLALKTGLEVTIPVSNANSC